MDSSESSIQKNVKCLSKKHQNCVLWTNGLPRQNFWFHRGSPYFYFLAGTKSISLKAIFQYVPKEKIQNLLALEANQIQIWQSKKIQRSYKALIMAKL